MKVLTERELVGMGYIEAGDDIEVRSAKAVLREAWESEESGSSGESGRMEYW